MQATAHNIVHNESKLSKINQIRIELNGETLITDFVDDNPNTFKVEKNMKS